MACLLLVLEGISFVPWIGLGFFTYVDCIVTNFMNKKSPKTTRNEGKSKSGKVRKEEKQIHVVLSRQVSNRDDSCGDKNQSMKRIRE